MYRINWIVILSLILFFGGCHTGQTEGAEDFGTDSNGEQNTDSATDEHPGSVEDTDSNTENGSDTGDATDSEADTETATETTTEPCETYYIDAGACPEKSPEAQPCEHECQLCEYGYLDDGCGGISLFCLKNKWKELYHTDPDPECDDAGSEDAGSGE